MSATALRGAAETVPIANGTSERVGRAMVVAVSPAALLLSLGAVIEWVATHRKHPHFSDRPPRTRVGAGRR
jgi:hypothetical protein